MPSNEKRIVYILRSEADPDRHCVGLTGNLPEQLLRYVEAFLTVFGEDAAICAVTRWMSVFVISFRRLGAARRGRLAVRRGKVDVCTRVEPFSLS